MDITNYNKAEILAALYNNSQPLGLGFLHADSNDMSTEEAQEILDNDRYQYFDYLKGRVMKIDMKGKCYQTFSPKSKKKRIVEKCKKKYVSLKIDTRLYNRDNGAGAAERVIESI